MKMELNNIYLGDAYKLIKEVPDKSVDLIYTDIPYDYTNGGKCGGMLKSAARKQTYIETIGQFDKGIDFSILNEFVRVMRYIYIYMVFQRPNIAIDEIFCGRKEVSIQYTRVVQN